ncbi:MAG: cation diffusion facilitator family transporter [Alphaproteobacteria bacterium]
MDEETVKQRSPFYAGYTAIVIVGILICVKAIAYYESGSMSVLSSLTDSVLDSLISIMTLASLYYARRPADEDHRWGHGKMEAVSALFQAAIIAGGGAFIVFEAINRLINPSEVTQHTLAIAVMIVSIILSFVLVLIQKNILKQSQSLAIEADSANYSSDIVINIGTLAVLCAGLYGTPQWIDPIFAILIALFMGITSRNIAIKSLNMLLDRELPEEDRCQVIDIIEAHNGVKGWHDLRTHRNGADFVMSFDIEVDPDMRLYDAHEIAKDLENSILTLFPNTEVLIHIDPCGYTDDARHRVKGLHH